MAQAFRQSGLATILRNCSVLLYFSSNSQTQQSRTLPCTMAVNRSSAGPYPSSWRSREHIRKVTITGCSSCSKGRFSILKVKCRWPHEGGHQCYSLLVVLCPQEQGGLVFTCGWIGVIWLILVYELWVEVICGIFTLKHSVANGRPPLYRVLILLVIVTGVFEMVVVLSAISKKPGAESVITGYAEWIRNNICCYWAFPYHNII